MNPPIPGNGNKTSLPVIENPNDLNLWSRVVVNELDRMIKIQASVVVRVEEMGAELSQIKTKAAIAGMLLSGLLMVAFEIGKWLLERK